MLFTRNSDKNLYNKINDIVIVIIKYNTNMQLNVAIAIQFSH